MFTMLDLQQTLLAWLGRRLCRKKELESLVGKLSHASRVVQPGKTFLLQLFELLKGTHKGFHRIHLNVTARSNIYWWSTFVQPWNGISLLGGSTKRKLIITSLQTLLAKLVVETSGRTSGFKSDGLQNTVLQNTSLSKIAYCYMSCS